MPAEPPWERVKEVVADALEQPVDARDGFVAAACAGDAGLRAAVTAMLHGSEDDFGGFLEQGPVAGLAPAQPDEMVGARIGGYRIERTIACGGMGAVFEAEQEHPKRRVAIKLLHATRMIPDARRRFELEVEVLGRLVHDSIAHLYEAGLHHDATGIERPFLVMELITGGDLIAATAEFTLEQKLELFAQVCDGVQFAHAQGVVHRDLKPANILVSRDGTPKILDFGIARLVGDGDPRFATLRTELGQILGTVSYMSPEQLSGDPARIDFRTDVYSLGVVLLELVTGQLPHDVHGLSLAAAARKIAESAPNLPRALARMRGGDLTRIVSMALEKDPARRYQSPAEFAADLRRLLRHEPITARQHSTFYHLAKFGRRHRGLVGAVAIVALALVAGVIVASIGLVRAERAREEAEAVNAFLNRMLSAAVPEELGRDVRVRTLLDLSADEIDAEFAERPHVRERLHETIGNAYRNLGRPTEAVHHLEIALALATARYGPAALETLRTQHSLAQALLNADRVDAADAAIAPTLARADLAQRESWLYFNALALDGVSRQARGDLNGAIERLESAAEGLARTAGATDPHTQTALNNLAGAVLAAGDGARAESILRRLLEARQQQYSAEHPRVLVTGQNLAVALLMQEKATEALATLRPLVELGAAVWGPDHPEQLTARHNLAEATSRIGEREAGLEAMRRVAADRERVLGPTHEDTLVSYSTLAADLMEQGDFAAAEPILARVLAGFEANGRARGTEALITRSNRAAALGALGRRAEAVRETEQVLELCVEIAGPDHPQVLTTRNNLACLVRDAGELQRACELFAANLAAADRAQPESPNNALHFAFNLGRCLMSLGRFAEAEPHLARAAAVARDRPGVRAPEGYRAALVECYQGLGRAEDAGRYR